MIEWRNIMMDLRFDAWVNRRILVLLIEIGWSGTIAIGIT